MGLWGKNEKVAVDKIRLDPLLTPKKDETWMTLAGRATNGRLPVYYAQIPFMLCVPFDLDYRPDLHPVGAEAIKRTLKAAQEGKFSYMIVYPRGKWFVVSDDYIFLFAALVGRPEYVPCWVLGKPENDLIKDVQGPLEVEEVKKIMGFG